MRMKRMAAVMLTITIMLALSATVFAGSHHGTNKTAHYYGDGHSYHKLCVVEDCTQTKNHYHDGTYYYAHHANDGHDYHDEWHYEGDGHKIHSEYHH